MLVASAPAPRTSSVPAMSRSPSTDASSWGSPARSPNTPAGSSMTRGPPLAAASWTAARSVQSPTEVAHRPSPGWVSGASAVPSTVQSGGAGVTVGTPLAPGTGEAAGGGLAASWPDIPALDPPSSIAATSTAPNDTRAHCPPIVAVYRARRRGGAPRLRRARCDSQWCAGLPIARSSGEAMILRTGSPQSHQRWQCARVQGHGR